MNIFGRKREAEAKGTDRQVLARQMRDEAYEAVPQYWGEGERWYGGATDADVPPDYFALMDAAQKYTSVTRRLATATPAEDLDAALELHMEICAQLRLGVKLYEDRSEAKVMLGSRPDMAPTLEAAIAEATTSLEAVSRSVTAAVAVAQNRAADLVSRDISIAAPTPGRRPDGKVRATGVDLG